MKKEVLKAKYKILGLSTAVSSSPFENPPPPKYIDLFSVYSRHVMLIGRKTKDKEKVRLRSVPRWFDN